MHFRQRNHLKVEEKVKKWELGKCGKSTKIIKAEKYKFKNW
jgi:hypothetical protein